MCDLLIAWAVLILHARYVFDERKMLDGEQTLSSTVTDLWRILPPQELKVDSHSEFRTWRPQLVGYWSVVKLMKHTVSDEHGHRVNTTSNSNLSDYSPYFQVAETPGNLCGLGLQETCLKIEFPKVDSSPINCTWGRFDHPQKGLWTMISQFLSESFHKVTASTGGLPTQELKCLCDD